MKQNILKKLARRKRKIAKRVKKRNWSEQPRPMMTGGNIRYEVDGRRQGIGCGGIGNIHQLALRSGLVAEIDRRLSLLKRHIPYHESDHVLNIAFNYLAGGSRLQDIELLRNDEAYLNALGAKIIPDPTTAGDFVRRFDQSDVVELMEIKNAVRSGIWKKQPASFRGLATINVDGTISPTCGQCKEGMDISYNGQWGYHPLIISLHESREPLYIVNRPGNVASHQGSAVWIDKSLDLVSRHFEKVQLRGDTDFSLTEHLDKWDKRCAFIFGVDAMANLVKIADGMSDWRRLNRRPKYEVKTQPRRRPENVKQQVVKRRKFKKIRTEAEHVSEFAYRPGKCRKDYRMIVLRKTLKVIRGELELFDDVRYFFYITNDWRRSTAEMIAFYRNRSDHENDVEQLKNGVQALNAASDSLTSNWALMVIASLAWDLKAWFGMLMSYRPLGKAVLRMEFKRFLNRFIQIPCLIIRTSRQIVYRFVGYNDQLKHIIKFSETLKAFGFP
ncbi:MAG TPA: IS1380 family transposase [Alphaproteobacteria bacterium]|nr:IS1380 family transposase [Alphaproteobacteria bacterium]